MFLVPEKDTNMGNYKILATEPSVIAFFSLFGITIIVDGFKQNSQNILFPSLNSTSISCDTTHRIFGIKYF